MIKFLITVMLFTIFSFNTFALNNCPSEDGVISNYDLEYCINKAKSGNKYAQYSLGMVYLKGGNKYSFNHLKEIKIDPIKSFFWFNEAAKNNHLDSMIRLASAYSRGKGTLENVEKSFYYINLAASKGSLNAKLILAGIYASDGSLNSIDSIINDSRIFSFNQKKFTDPFLDYNINLISHHNYLRDKLNKQFFEMLDYEKSSIIYKQLLHNERNINSQLSKFIIVKLERLNFRKKYFYEHYIWASINNAISSESIYNFNDINISKRNISKDEMNIANSYIQSFLEKGFPDFEVDELFKNKVITLNEKQGTGSLKVSSTGSGFYINKNGQIITNYHVTKSCEKISIVHLNERTNAKLKVFDENIDVSILDTNKINSSKSIFRDDEIQLGENVMVVGFPLQGILSSSANVTTGIISATMGIQDNNNFYQISAPIQSGNSGGAVLDEYGYVIGIVVSKLDSIKLMNLAGEIPQNVNFAIQKNKILTFLKSKNIKYETSNNLKKISTVLRAGKGKAMSVMIECWN